MKLKTLGLVALLLIRCNNPTTTDTVTKENKELADKNSNNSLTGVWTDGSGPNATFSIMDDSIRDVEHNTRTKFDVLNDSIILYYPDDTVKAKMYKTHDDTLVYEYSGVKTKYWRFEN